MEKQFWLCLLLCLITVLTGCNQASDTLSSDPASFGAPSSDTAPENGIGPAIAEDNLSAMKIAVQAEFMAIGAALADLPAHSDTPLYHGEDRALWAQAEQAIAELGYPIDPEGRKPMANYERVMDFMEAAKAGKPAYVTIYRISTYAQLNVRSKSLFFDGTVFSCSSGSLGEIGVAYIAEDITLSENGYLIITYQPDNGDVFRVMPLEDNCYEAFSKYISMFYFHGDSVLRTNWDENNMDSLAWLFIFERLWNYNHDYALTNDDTYFIAGGDLAEREYTVFPAELVEDTLQKYFNVSTEKLRNIKHPHYPANETPLLYDAATNSYRIQGFVGGGGPARFEVWRVAENPDGSISLDIGAFYGASTSDGHHLSTLTIMPQPDGGFKYISNVLAQ